jgi:hypothetical protein
MKITNCVEAHSWDLGLGFGVADWDGVGGLKLVGGVVELSAAAWKLEIGTRSNTQAPTG